MLVQFGYVHIRIHKLPTTARQDKRRIRKENEQRVYEEQLMLHRIQVEERRILIANRKLQTIRLLPELFHRIKVTGLPRQRSALTLPPAPTSLSPPPSSHVAIPPPPLHRPQGDVVREEALMRDREVEREKIKQVKRLLREQHETRKKAQDEAKRKKVVTR